MRPFVAQDIYRYTCERIFLGWLTGAPVLLASLQKGVDGIENHPEHLRFTLPALFAFSLFLYGNQWPDSCVEADYKAYRSLLYKSGTNSWLKQQGGMVEVFCGHEDHNFTVYQLRRWQSD